MDIFTTTVTSCQLIYSFLNGCKDFSDDAKSLAARFDHDTKALQRVQDYFSSQVLKDASGRNKLPLDHQVMLDSCVNNLEGLLSKAQALSTEIQSKKWYRVGINHSTWWLYKSDFESLAKEMFEWTQRFDVHTFSLPNSIKNVINFQEESIVSEPSPVSLLAVQQRGARIVELDRNRRIEYVENLYITDNASRVVLGKTVASVLDWEEEVLIPKDLEPLMISGLSSRRELLHSITDTRIIVNLRPF